MKVIDLYLAIERNKNIPKKVVYNYKTYRYYPEYKRYYREEYGDMISLFSETTMEDKVYLIEDTPKEKTLINPIEKFTDDGYDYYVYNKYGTKCNISTHDNMIVDKINEIIDRLNGE